MIQLGSLVRYTSEFCKSIQLHTPPINGLVVKIDDLTAHVVWCDDDRQTPMRILLANIELHPVDRTISDSFRKTIMKEFNVN